MQLTLTGCFQCLDHFHILYFVMRFTINEDTPLLKIYVPPTFHHLFGAVASVVQNKSLKKH